MELNYCLVDHTQDQAFISDLVIEHTDTGNSGTYICRSSDREVGSLKVTVLVGGCLCGVRVVMASLVD